MTAAPDWPAYPIGPRESIFAMGVASIKFVELESVLSFIFGTVFGLRLNDKDALAAKMGRGAVVDLIRERLPETMWPQSQQDDVVYFLTGFDVCASNRNQLAHSALAWIGDDTTILYKTVRTGKTQAAAPPLDQLRAVADDMHAYWQYGQALGNAINNRLFDPPLLPAAAFPWPDRPAPPRKLSYTGEPLRLPSNSR